MISPLKVLKWLTWKLSSHKYYITFTGFLHFFQKQHAKILLVNLLQRHSWPNCLSVWCFFNHFNKVQYSHWCHGAMSLAVNDVNSPAWTMSSSGPHFSNHPFCVFVCFYSPALSSTTSSSSVSSWRKCLSRWGENRSVLTRCCGCCLVS